MASSDPPSPYFNGIIFNPSFFETSSTSALTQTQANDLYLRKTTTDIATALETFSQGIQTPSIISTLAIQIGETYTPSIDFYTHLWPQYSLPPPLGAIGSRVLIPIFITLPLNPMTTNAEYTTHSIILSAGVWLITGSQQLTITSGTTTLQRTVAKLTSYIATVSTTLALQTDSSNAGAAAIGSAIHPSISQVIQLTAATTIQIKLTATYLAGTVSIQTTDPNLFYATRLA